MSCGLKSGGLMSVGLMSGGLKSYDPLPIIPYLFSHLLFSSR